MTPSRAAGRTAAIFAASEGGILSGPAEPGTAPLTPALRAPPAPGAGALRTGAPDAGGADARGYRGGGCAADEAGEVEAEGDGADEGGDAGDWAAAGTVGDSAGC